ncbi:MAG: S9 family peptidase, partial [Actinomycetes bacterium]
NVLAEGSDFFALGVFDLSADHTRLAYAVDLDGSERYTLHVRDLEAGADLDDTIGNVTYGSAWSADGQTLFYVRPDEAMRPWQVWRHRVGTPADADELVHQEDDERFFVSVGLTRSDRWVVIHAESKMTSEARVIPATEAGHTPRIVLPRRQGVEYDVEHVVLAGGPEAWLVRTNAPTADGAPVTNFALHALPVDGSRWEELVEVLAHRPDVKLEAVDGFAGHVVVVERADGLEVLRVLELTDRLNAPFGDGHVIEQPDPVYSLGGGINADWDVPTYRFGYTSLVTPLSSVDYGVRSRARTVVKVQPVRDYRAEDFQTDRIWATAPDGRRIPISLVAPKDQPRDGTAPCVLYGYGSYEITIDPTFSPARLNLLERGFTFAIAHIRGGGELGRHWYEEGRLASKPNTFGDFIACAEHLVAEGWTRPDRLVARGGSAGGLLMGVVTNLRPDLWRAVVAEVPFVDVVTTMSDTSLPLTVTEWEEWGNPIDDPDAYAVMKSYSPYDNVAATDHPAIYATGGLNDPRVGFWEPAKWVAKLRAVGTGDQPVLLRTEMGAGHQGPSGRYDAWRDEARVQAFVLRAVGITD